MSGKTTSAYLIIFRELRSNVLVNPNKVRLIMSDFELALRNAAKEIFVNAHMTGCEVHQDRVSNDISYFCNTRKQKLCFYIMLVKNMYYICKFIFRQFYPR